MIGIKKLIYCKKKLLNKQMQKQFSSSCTALNITFVQILILFSRENYR